jgi:hypothetical protein
MASCQPWTALRPDLAGLMYSVAGMIQLPPPCAPSRAADVISSCLN